MQEFFDWFRWLYDATGINLTIFYDSFDRSRFVNGVLTTLKLAASCVTLSVAVGVVGAWLQGSRLNFTRRVVYWYIQLFRNTPPLVQLYFFYFGIGHLVKGASGVPLVTNMQWAIFALSLYAGAFNVEIFRSGIEAVPRATIEAAESLGFSRLRAYVLIVLPLAFRISLPALVRDRRARTALCLEPDLVGLGQRAGNDERAADLLCEPRRHPGVAHAQVGKRNARARVRNGLTPCADSIKLPPICQCSIRQR